MDRKYKVIDETIELADERKAEGMPGAERPGNPAQKLVFKVLHYTLNNHQSQLSLDMMEHVNSGWNVVHIEKDMVIYSKPVSEQVYEKYHSSVTASVDSWNNTFVD